ncbi:MAG: BamA/TamA family outer membrane protein [Pseudanabaenaceae cyanobacterium]
MAEVIGTLPQLAQKLLIVSLFACTSTATFSLSTLAQGVPPLIPPEAPEPEVLVGEVFVKNEGDVPLPPEIEKLVYDTITTKPGRLTTRRRIQEDIQRVFNLGFFTAVNAQPEDTDIGVRITFLVQPNPILKSVETEGTSAALEPNIIDRLFANQVGKIINLRQVREAVQALEKSYQDRGFVLAQVVDIRAQPDGRITLVVAEGLVEDIRVAFLNEEGKTVDGEGRPITGATRPFIITRELSLQPGQVFNRNVVQSDLQKVFGLGLFDDVNLKLDPGTDPRKVIVTVNVRERNTGSIALGAGLSSATGFFGTLSFQQQNFGGNNQKVAADIQVGERDLLFDLSFTDPWIGGDPNRTSFTANAFSRRIFSFVFDGAVGVGPFNETARVNRLGGGISFSRPLDSRTTASLGLRYERVSIADAEGTIRPLDVLGNPLTVSADGQDDLFTLQFAYAVDQRDDPNRPTSGSVLRLATEQALPFGSGSLLYNRLRASYSFYIPVSFVNFAEGAQTLAFNVQGGTVIGTFPPYDAFQIGGSNSVRGWEEGRIGSGRSFGVVSAEYRFPVFNIIGGVLFFDYGTDFGSGASVIGNPAGVRLKPGDGSGYGVGLRIQSPLGAIRIDYGINLTTGGSQISFGLGEKF